MRTIPAGFSAEAPGHARRLPDLMAAVRTGEAILTCELGDAIGGIVPRRRPIGD